MIKVRTVANLRKAIYSGCDAYEYCVQHNAFFTIPNGTIFEIDEKYWNSGESEYIVRYGKYQTTISRVYLLKVEEEEQMDNYIMIQGKKIELSEESVKSIVEGLGEKATYETGFERVTNDDDYYFIQDDIRVEKIQEEYTMSDDAIYNAGNYFSNKETAEKMAKKVKLLLLLERFSAEHDGDKINWSNSDQIKYCILYKHHEKEFRIGDNYTFQQHMVYFISEDVAKQALTEYEDLFREVYGV